MTDGRVKALEAVVKAARNVTNEYASVGDATAYALDRLCAAFNDLDRHTDADVEMETVTLAVWEDENDGEIKQYRLGGKGDQWVQDECWARLGTMQITIMQEGKIGPSIRARGGE